MKVRNPCAPQFYQGNVQNQIKRFLKDFITPVTASSVVAGVVPHAGWFYSGGVAAKVYASLAENPPATVILFGTVHNIAKVRKNSIYPEGVWKTPI